MKWSFLPLSILVLSACAGVCFAQVCGDDVCEADEYATCVSDCCGDPESGDCCEYGVSAPGCNDADCCAAVCSFPLLHYCCTGPWRDPFCALKARALSVCGNCGYDCPCDADINQDGKTNTADIGYVTQCAIDELYTPGSAPANCDINCDGIIDFRDVGFTFASFQALPDPCGVPTGACCLNEWPWCILTTELSCPTLLSGDGVYQGDGSTCAQAGCHCTVADAPQPEPFPIDKNRYISLAPGNAGMQTALRVTLVDLPGSYNIWNGATMWATDPHPVTELSGSDAGGPAPTFNAASLSCTQDCHDWGALGVVHIFGEAIIPGARYELQAVDCGCDPADEGSYSARLDLFTGMYGDLVGQFDNGACWWTLPNASVSIPFDTVSAMNKFENRVCSPMKVRADLVGVPPNRACVDQVISVTDYSDTVGAFKGNPYSFSPTALDPCDALPCPNP